MKRLFVALCLILPAVSWAEYMLQDDVSDEIAVVAAVLDGGVSFAKPVRTEGYSMLTLEAEVDLDGGTSRTLTMTCASVKGEDISGGVPSKTYPIPACDGVSTPVIACGAASWPRTIAADTNIIYNIPLNYQYVYCSWAMTPATNADYITVEGRLGAK